MHITFERLKYLVAVAQHGSFSAAARELGVSNTAVNKTIQALEFDLELNIFERHHGKRPQLTDAGKKLYVQALDIVPKVLLMEQHAETLSLGIEPSLTIAVHPYTLSLEFNQLLSELNDNYPTLELKFIDAESLTSYDDEFDIYVGPSRHQVPRGMNVLTITQFEWRVVCAPTFPLTKYRGHIEPEDMDKFSQILLTEGFCTKPEYREAMRYSTRVISVDSFYQMREMLLAGLGFALYPAHLSKPLVDNGQLVDLMFEFGTMGNYWPVEALWRNQLGIAGEWLIERITEQSTKEA
ncbi:LysR family transcriptional regulator [Shewanella maritima]|uniref:LysR family transcriptional regulator n=1 Tax=Shewanella maritima TaxID=2520507 RepID=A0A411PG42_9GAMM|nr:LysR family transcriptional regulator [Shewanella maritima]QBF82557.1 LysR family transcriptional regulator [Shewanella maritima]